jgi:PAS domain S-box-containing protein
MASTTPDQSLAELARACADATDPDALLAEALPLLRQLTGVAEDDVAVEHRADQVDVTMRVPVPAPGDGHADGEVALALLRQTLGRLGAQHRYDDLVQRVDNAQQLANMGDYDWHIPTDTNRWSDQLYRIYGHEPQSFNASYERFLSLIHPDDRERITGVHQQAYATGEPYQMIERIVRPDGETRYLSSNGQVVMDETGTPVRMRGTCIDITDRVQAEDARQRSAARFQAMVECSPDAIMLLDDAGAVVQANGRASELLGGDPVGHAFSALVPTGVAEVAAGVEATGVDGRRLTLDLASAVLTRDDHEDEAKLAVFVHDASARLESEALAASLREAQVRRRQALEINDNVVQGLTAAAYALEQGNVGASTSFLQRTLSAARKMMNDLLEPLDGEDLQAGDLLRSEAAVLEDAPASEDAAEEVGKPAPRRRVLVVDDSEDVRTLLCLKLATLPTFEVVGEAVDGAQAVEVATEQQPDLILLDLAMPRMDGLEALPLLREAVDDVRVVVLSGFDKDAMAEKALAAGADSYVEKGTAMSDLAEVLGSV